VALCNPDLPPARQQQCAKDKWRERLKTAKIHDVTFAFHNNYKISQLVYLSLFISSFLSAFSLFYFPNSLFLLHFSFILNFLLLSFLFIIPIYFFLFWAFLSLFFFSKFVYIVCSKMYRPTQPRTQSVKRVFSQQTNRLGRDADYLP
jgi:positive regulator of sigma E activity